MPPTEPDTNELLDRAQSGDGSAADQLFVRHRGRLRQMIAARMDRRLSMRIDPSDVVQETLVAASQKLDDYLRDRPLPFYPWLRQLAWERLVQLRHHHISVRKRSVDREVTGVSMLSDESVNHFASRFVHAGSSPSRQAIRQEVRERVSLALDGMAPHDREVLIMWYLEQLTITEIAAILEITESGVKSRHRRALVRLTSVLRDDHPKE